MKKLKQTLLYLFGFAFLLLLITVVINLNVFDEELLPEVAAIKNIKAQPYSEDNAYPAILALSSAQGPSLKQATKTIREHLNQQIAENGLDYLNQEDYQRLIGSGHDKSLQNIYYNCKSRTEKNCMASLIEDVSKNPISDERLIAQLKRYADLIKMTAYQDATQIDINAPYVAFGSIQQLKRLFLADAYINHSTDEYLKTWQQDMNFWRMVLADNHILITQMIAIASVFNSIDSLSTSINQGALSPQQLSELQRQIKTLSKKELDMGTTFDYEFKYGMCFFEQAEATGGIGNFIENLFYQPQATTNLNYEFVTRPLKQVSALSSVEFYQHVTGANKEVKFSSPFNWSPTTLYNPLGKQLISYAIPAYNDYIARVHDLNGMMYLLKLQIEIAMSPNRSVEQVIAQSKYTNPYTLEPMDYNSETHSIYFECLDKYSVCELSL